MRPSTDARRPPLGVLPFAAQVLRGHAQVTFLPSAAAGAVFCVALFAAGWEYGLYGLAGTAVGTATARALGAPREGVSTGLEGFNACLTALCFAVFLGAEHLSTAGLALAGCVVVTVVTAAMTQLLGVWRLPPLTMPYCLLAGAMTLAAPGFERVGHHANGPAALPREATGPTTLQLTDLTKAFFADFAQIFFMPQWYVGALLLLGLFVASRRAGAVACLGSLVGIGSAWALGAPAARIADGSMGYNSVLVALALCGTFLPVRGATLAYALVGAATATAVGPALSALLAPSGGHAFTWPFILTTLVFLAAAPSFPRLRTTIPAPSGRTAPESAATGGVSGNSPAPQAP
ncbi:urea transporter [Streptomyces sp. NBC_01381]|uniref:urea transporter n=1 Tax=Streptomyces sp. NBC_01381 TaxID=2903845 RepID=UPI00224CE9E3|nr:urea transporter [Streptomyces sp. NBC_01381]MCX4668370.1 urea transporter [Streptomyces sp. NBC_01381]